MENLNVGIVNHVLTNFLTESIENDEFKKLSIELFNLLESSPILELEYNVMNNLSNKNNNIHKSVDKFVDKYIDDNIKLFETYTLDEFDSEQKKLIPLIENYNINSSSDKYKLYNSIHNLIRESLKISNEIDVDLVHDSFYNIHEHIRKSQLIEKEDDDLDNINEEILKIAIDEFNDNYLTQLNENELELFKNLISNKYDEKLSIFENYKEKCVDKLNENIETIGDEKLNLTKKRIDDLNNTPQNINENIIKLFELKNGL